MAVGPALACLLMRGIRIEALNDLHRIWFSCDGSILGQFIVLLHWPLLMLRPQPIEFMRITYRVAAGSTIRSIIFKLVNLVNYSTHVSVNDSDDK